MTRPATGALSSGTATFFFTDVYDALRDRFAETDDVLSAALPDAHG